MFWEGLNLTREQFINLGKQSQSGGYVQHAVLATSFRHSNGVSELHGEVARKMWNFLWPDAADSAHHSITSGMPPALAGPPQRRLFDRASGGLVRAPGSEIWSRVDQIPDLELWDVRRHLKRKLINYAIEQARSHWQSGKRTPAQVIVDGVMLDQYSLTIGFARRFATYKRAYMLFSDYERLLKIVTNRDMPVQIILAGKAHPADEPGKLMIQRVYRAAKDHQTSGRIVFLEDYDLNIARLLVLGVDVWMNTPRRPNEASGTSGMKAALNGTLNFSVLDGWWREGFNGSNGWAIGDETDYDDPNLQDERDAASMYDTLENQIIPMFYHTRSMGDASSQWIAKIKESMRSLGWQFSTRRMLKEYLRKLYLPALDED